MILLGYYFAYIGTYVGDEPPKQDEEMEEEIKQPIGHRPIMPRRLDHRFHTELEDHICDLFVREGVPIENVREIRRDPYLFDIWFTLPHDMMLMMLHVVSAPMLI